MRAQARKILSQITLHQQPSESVTFKDAFDAYLATEGLKMGDAHRKEVTRLFNRHLLPSLERKPLSNIETKPPAIDTRSACIVRAF